MTALVAACEAVKKRRFECRKCGTSNEVEINDAVAAAGAARSLVELTAGRSPVADSDEQQGLTYVRTTYPTVSAERALALCDAALAALAGAHEAPSELHALRLELLSSIPPATDDPGGAPPSE